MNLVDKITKLTGKTYIMYYCHWVDFFFFFFFFFGGGGLVEVAVATIVNGSVEGAGFGAACSSKRDYKFLCPTSI